jgi:hypothetical protein
VNKNIKLDDTKNIIQMDTSTNNQINNNLNINSQLNQSNQNRNTSIKSSQNININNINLLQSPKNIYKNINFEEKNLSEQNQSKDNDKKIVSKIKNNYNYF